MFLGELIWESPDGIEILRCKGLFEGNGTSSDAIHGEYMLQGVGDVFELRPMGAGGRHHAGPANFLFVGRGMNMQEIKEGISSCIKPNN